MATGVNRRNQAATWCDVAGLMDGSWSGLDFSIRHRYWGRPAGELISSWLGKQSRKQTVDVRSTCPQFREGNGLNSRGLEEGMEKTGSQSLPICRKQVLCFSFLHTLIDVQWSHRGISSSLVSYVTGFLSLLHILTYTLKIQPPLKLQPLPPECASIWTVAQCF